ncbi:MAG: cysteine desulfurase family protein [Ruthenibacterium sp.]
MHYLDFAATTPVAAPVADVADKVLRTFYANPSSLYLPGVESEAVLNKARETVAHTLGCAPETLRFTASGSEANNLAILGACRAREKWAKHIVVTGYEHPSVQNVCKSLADTGWSVTVVAPDRCGHVDRNALTEAVTDRTALVAAMQVNNEIGSILDVAALASAVKAKNSRTAVHVDGVQAWCKVPLCLAKTEIDSYAVSGHKIHAPKGVGALYLRRGHYMLPVFFGGHQEQGFRPGTENIAYLAAMAKAAALAQEHPFDPAPLRERLLRGLAALPFVTLNSPADGYAGIVNFSVDGIKSEPMLHYLEEREIYVSSGSACSRGEASHTLSAMGLPKSRIDTALRVSFGQGSTPEDVDALLCALREGESVLAKLRRR